MRQSVSTIESTEEPDFAFYKTKKIIIPTFRPAGLLEANVVDELEESIKYDNLKVLEFISDSPKMFYTLTGGPHHFINDTVGVVLKFVEENPKVKLYLDITEIKNSDQKMYDFFYKVLKDLSVDFELISLVNVHHLIADNFYIVKNFYRYFNSPEYVYKYYSKYFSNKDAAPTKKVYLSRKLIPERDWSNPKNTLSIKNDYRINNEYKLEQFLHSHGFDIIQPELFESFEDQVNYFSDVKLLVSSTSAGLVNSYFMKPGSNVVELVTPMLFLFIDNIGDKSGDYHVQLHHFYQLSSYLRNLNHVSIPNNKRDADDLIYKIKNDKFISELFGIHE